MSLSRPVALTIAGSDSGGGAGIQADLKTFEALNVFGTCAITAVTAQNTYRVAAVEPVSVAMLEAQLDAIFDDFTVAAVKIGMLGSEALLSSVQARLQHYGVRHIVLDPVMVSTSGDALAPATLAHSLWGTLIPEAALITPNLSEAEALLGARIVGTESGLREAARALQAQGAVRVLLKGGHLKQAQSMDIFADDQGKVHTLNGARIETPNTHGTGCVLSSAITALAARGVGWREAAMQAKRFLSEALEAGQNILLGRGHGPCLLRVPRNILP